MPIKCRACGYENPMGAVACDLCKGPLRSPDKALGHRMPTGHFRVISGEVTTTATSIKAVRPAPVSAVGRLAVQAAAESGTYPTVADGPPSTLTGRPNLLGRLKLIVEQGLIIGEQYLLSESEMIIGRGDAELRAYPDIDLAGQDNDYVHRTHARLQFHDQNTRLSVEHLGSANPTLVNNVPVDELEMVELQVNDRLRVGRVVMRLLVVE